MTSELLRSASDIPAVEATLTVSDESGEATADFARSDSVLMLAWGGSSCLPPFVVLPASTLARTAPSSLCVPVLSLGNIR